MMHKIRFVKGMILTYNNWIDTVLDSMWLFPKGQTKLYRLRNGLVFKCRNSTTDVSTVHTMFIKKENTEFIDELPPNAVVIDIGANIGTFTVYLANKKPGANIYCYEPLPDNFKLLNENILLNRLAKVKTFQLAISDRRDIDKLYFSEKYNAGATISKTRKNPGDISVDVRSITIDDVFRNNKIKHVDLLKLDCEGVDYKIIDSIPAHIFNKIERIHAEYHSEEEKKIMVSKLASKGFRFKTVDSGDSLDSEYYGNIYAKKKSG